MHATTPNSVLTEGAIKAFSIAKPLCDCGSFLNIALQASATNQPELALEIKMHLTSLT